MKWMYVLCMIFAISYATMAQSGDGWKYDLKTYDTKADTTGVYKADISMNYNLKWGMSLDQARAAMKKCGFKERSVSSDRASYYMKYMNLEGIKVKETVIVVDRYNRLYQLKFIINTKKYDDYKAFSKKLVSFYEKFWVGEVSYPITKPFTNDTVLEYSIHELKVVGRQGSTFLVKNDTEDNKGVITLSVIFEKTR